MGQPFHQRMKSIANALAFSVLWLALFPLLLSAAVVNSWVPSGLLPHVLTCDRPGLKFHGHKAHKMQPMRAFHIPSLFSRFDPSDHINWVSVIQPAQCTWTLSRLYCRVWYVLHGLPPDNDRCLLQAIAASPEGAVNGYAIGSYLYLGIVYAFPIGLGLGGLALDLPVRRPPPPPPPPQHCCRPFGQNCMQ